MSDEAAVTEPMLAELQRALEAIQTAAHHANYASFDPPAIAARAGVMVDILGFMLHVGHALNDEVSAAEANLRLGSDNSREPTLHTSQAHLLLRSAIDGMGVAMQSFVRASGHVRHLRVES
jgi:hypothetical protein